MNKDESRTLSRLMNLLGIVAANAPGPLKLAALTDASGLPRATTHRLLASLEFENLIENTANGYLIGAKCWSLGMAAAKRFDLSDLVQSSVERLAVETGDVGLFSIKTEVHARCISRVEGTHPILPTSIQIGAVRPLGCGAHALAILAALNDHDVEDAIASTAIERAAQYPYFSDLTLRAKIEETRARGYASAEGEIVPGMVGLAIAVRDAWFNVVGSISCTAIAERMPVSRHSTIVAMLREEVSRIEMALGRELHKNPKKGKHHG